MVPIIQKITSLFRKYGAYIALGALSVVFIPGEYKEFGEIGWKILLIIMFSKPIYDIFPKLASYINILPLRRQLGIISASFILAHGVGAYLVGWRIDGGILTNPQDFLLWGVLGGLMAIPLLATSNNKAVKILKKNWKPLQRLAYFFFVFGVLHIYFMGKDVEVLFILGAWIVLKLMAMKGIVLWKK